MHVHLSPVRKEFTCPGIGCSRFFFNLQDNASLLLFFLRCSLPICSPPPCRGGGLIKSSDHDVLEARVLALFENSSAFPRGYFTPGQTNASPSVFPAC